MIFLAHSPPSSSNITLQIGLLKKYLNVNRSSFFCNLRYNTPLYDGMGSLIIITNCYKVEYH
jgi:hypothetical protein